MTYTYADCQRRMERIATLKDGWDTYHGLAITGQAMDSAHRVIEAARALDLPAPQPCPIGTGGVNLEWAVGEAGLEIECRPHGTVETLLCPTDDSQTWEESDILDGEEAEAEVTRALTWLKSLTTNGIDRSQPG